MEQSLVSHTIIWQIHKKLWLRIVVTERLAAWVNWTVNDKEDI
jgi:hypothetical protein